MKTLLGILIAAALSAAVCHGKSSLTMNGVNWGTNYYDPDVTVGTDFDKDPTNAVPSWVQGSLGPLSTRLVTNEYLRVNTTGTNDSQLNFRQTSGWDGSLDSTIEFTLRVDSLAAEASYAGSFLFGTGTKWQNMSISPTNVVLGGGSSTLGDFTNWTTFRLTLSNMSGVTPVMKLYINNSTNAVQTSSSVNIMALAYLQFGDGSSGVSENGIIDWESIRWTSTGAFAPEAIPEPAAALLLSAVVAGMLLRLRRKNAS